jgi:phage shock protein PspC (stress-responsive transcriptional regulator)
LGRLHLALGGHCLGGVAPSFLPKSSTATCHCDLGRAWCLFGTSVRCVALFCTRMATHRLVLSTGLAARFGCVFAILRAMAVLPAEMGATFEQLPTYLTAARISQPAGHVFQHPLSTKTRLLGQEWTLGTVLLVCVAGMRGLRVATSLWTLTGEVTSWWLCATRLWRI